MRRYISITKNFWIFLIALVFSATLFACTAATYYGPPRVHFHGPPHLHHIPGSYVYVVADMDVGIFFYNGYWYRNYNNFWFRARYYNGSWIKVVIASVPPRLHKLPGSWRSHLRRDAYRIPHRDLKQHYKRWERERYWDKDRGREYKKMKKKYKEKKQDYRKKKRRHDSELREPERDDRREGMRPVEHVEDGKKRTDDKAHEFVRPAEARGKPVAVKDTKQPSKPKKADVKETGKGVSPKKAEAKGKDAKKKVASKKKGKGKKKGKKDKGEGDEGQDGEEGEESDDDENGDKRGKGSSPR